MYNYTPKLLTLKIVFLFLIFFSFSGWSQTESAFEYPSDPLLTLADSLANYGDFEQCLSTLKRYKTKAWSNADDNLKAFMFLKMAETLFFVGELAEALKNIEQAEVLLGEEGDRYLLSERDVVRAIYFNRKGGTDQAIKFAEKALATKTELFSERRKELGKCYEILASIYGQTGDSRRAENCFLKVLEIINQTPDYPVFAQASCFYNLSNYNRDKRKILPALSYAKEATKIIKSLGESQSGRLARCYAVEANAYLYLEEFDKAIECNEKAVQLTMATPERQYLGYYYTNLGVTYYNLEDYGKAVDYYRKSMNVSTGEDPIVLPYTYSKFGEIYIEMNQLDSAFYYLEQARRMFKNQFSDESDFIAEVDNLFGDYYSKKGNDTLALQNYHQSLLSAIRGYDDPNLFSLPKIEQCIKTNLAELFLSNKAKVLSRMGLQSKNHEMIENALALYQLIDRVHLRKQDFLEIETGLHDISHIHQTYGDAIDLLFQLYQTEAKEEYLQIAFDYMERVKARILLNKLIGLKNADQLNLPEDLLAKEQLLNTQLEELLFESEEGQDSLFVLSLTRIMNDKKSLSKEIEKKAPNYFQNRYHSNQVSFKEVQAKLGKDDTRLLQYFWTEETIFAICISKKSIALKKIENSKILKSNIDLYQKILYGEKIGKDYTHSVQLFHQAASSIYHDLVSPFFSSEFPENIIIVPDGALSDLSFDALVTDTEFSDQYNFYNLPYFIKKTSISYAYSSGTLINQGIERTLEEPVHVLAFAYSDEASLFEVKNENLPELPGTMEELDALQKIYKKGYHEFRGHQASKVNFLNHFQHYDIIHLALHAESDPSLRQNSRIYFRPSENQDSSEYVLYAHEFYQHPLEARMVVLSACETGQGKSYKGEGIYSMARGFSYAGVPTVIMSLWQLSDQAGKVIMPDFYQNIQAGKSVDKALQMAKIDFLETADKLTAHPANWATFVSLGDQSPIQINTSLFSKPWIRIVSLVLLVLAFFFFKKK